MQENINNRTLFYGDNLDVLRGMNSKTVDLIYMDPPFNKNNTFTGNNKKINDIKTWFQKRQNAKQVFMEVDFEAVFKDEPSFKDVWNKNDLTDSYYTILDNYNEKLISYLESIRKSSPSGTFYYLMYMAVRLIEMHRILKDTGSLYYHCDSHVSHYIKNVMDKIFGIQNFRNEIVWCYHGPGSPQMRQFNRKTDILFWYCKGRVWTFNKADVRMPFTDPNQSLRRAMSTSGTFSKEEVDAYRKKGKVPENWWEFRIAARSKREYLGYPTQKPLALLERIVKASSNEEDVVLDPFCGCATTCIAAEKLDRKWIGIDISEKAFYMVYYRLMHDTEHLREDFLYHSKIKWSPETKPPIRTDLTEAEHKQQASLLFISKSHQKYKRIPFTEEEREVYKDLLYEEQKGFCNGCFTYLRKVQLTIDHIQPVASGGTNDYENLQLLCYMCNNWKRQGDMKGLFKTLLEKEFITQELYKAQVKRYTISS